MSTKREPQSPATDSEEQLIARAQEAVSQCRWIVGECAFQWTKRYARGRTDADFAALIGLTGDQVFQRRRVWEAFGRLKDEFSGLKWSHFYAALNWDDARDCLDWAAQNSSTVAEMKAWRRAQRGEDLSAEADTETMAHLPSEMAWVQDPAEFGSPSSEVRGAGAGARSGEAGERAVASVQRQSSADGDDYAPYRSVAGSPAPGDETVDAGATSPPPSPEQIVKRMASTLERCAKVLTPGFVKEFHRLPAPLRERFLKSVRDLHARAAELK